MNSSKPQAIDVSDVSTLELASNAGAVQEIYRSRRRYNQWVADQTLEDYALRFTAKSARNWSLGKVANTALGAISFLALEAIGAALTINFGVTNTLWAVGIVGAIIFLCGLPICIYAAKYGVDIDLLTRGAGFGYLGSTATSLIYASFTFIFFALEAVIMARALEIALGLPLQLGYVISSLVILPLVFYGITFISKFQTWTQSLWIALQVVPFIFIFASGSEIFPQWLSFNGNSGHSGKLEGNGSGFDLALFGAASAILFSLMAQIGEQVDFLRFLPEKTRDNANRWWAAVILAGPGWIILGVLKILAGSLLSYLAIEYFSLTADEVNPTSMYQIAFSYIADNAELALTLSVIFVIVCQMKINVTNAYAGSIAWSNFFSRLTHNHPGRVVWLIFNVLIALLLMELGVYQAFENTLSIYAVVAVCWVGALVADLVVNKPLGLSPKHIEFRRAYLHEINPVGVGSVFIGSLFGITCYLGIFGEIAHSLAHFFALALCFILVPIFALISKGKYYIARKPEALTSAEESIECCICLNKYEREDMAMCPAYSGPICSLCCSLDARCQDSCKDKSQTYNKFIRILALALPSPIRLLINERLIKLLTIMLLVTGLLGIFLSLVYATIESPNPVVNALISESLWKVFFILCIISGVIAWLFVLAHESRRTAQDESNTQTKRLIQEIRAHERTDLKLQRAKEIADAANNAKSRYLSGISHELRTPLNSLLGYAQLLETDRDIAIEKREQISVIKRGGEHLADIIEGLLDISKIEAGKLDIKRSEIRFKDLISQIEKMFSIQAEEKNIGFIYDINSPLPDYVMGDEKRIRQILINVLSNAIKFTQRGLVQVSVSYRSQVMFFKVDDSGPGIAKEDYQRIFEPFERLNSGVGPIINGTGLGLTITKLLTDAMGGEIALQPSPYGGMSFLISLYLSRLNKAKQPLIEKRKIYGYQGERKTVMIVDDNESHRQLIQFLLTPLGFAVRQAEYAEDCINQINYFKPDLFLIDRRMPGMDGITLSKKLRNIGLTQPIVIISANAKALDDFTELEPMPHNAYLSKPIQLDSALEKIHELLKISWIYESDTKENKEEKNTLLTRADLPDTPILAELIYASHIGNLTRLKEIVLEIESSGSASMKFLQALKYFVKTIQFHLIVKMIKQCCDEVR